MARLAGMGAPNHIGGMGFSNRASGARPRASAPMGSRGFELRLERMVEGAFARAFKSVLRPVELGRRMIREMDDHRSVGVRGDTVVPNSFTVALSTSDLEQFEGVQDSLARELDRKSVV